MLPWHPESKLSENEQKEEEEHFLRMLRVFSSYQEHTQRTVLNKYLRDYERLTREQTALISPSYAEKIARATTCTRVNQLFFDQVVSLHQHRVRGQGEGTGWEREEGPGNDRFCLTRDNQATGCSRPSDQSLFVRPTRLEMDNLRSCLRQLMREWSDEGRPERDASYQPILEALEGHFPRPDERPTLSVLVPGAGLGRLPYEISQRGFICQGNEFSMFMLLPSQYLLTVAPAPHSIELHPWALPFSNNVSQEEQFRRVRLPDVEILPAPTDFSMVAGDFLQVYGHHQEPDGATTTIMWDAIVTCFFLDTAKNIIQYIELIHKLLRPGGIWINHGPLLYHFEGHSEEPSIELSIEEIRMVIERLGLTIEKEEIGSKSLTYAQNQHSLHQTGYRCWFFIVRKPSIE